MYIKFCQAIQPQQHSGAGFRGEGVAQEGAKTISEVRPEVLTDKDLTDFTAQNLYLLADRIRRV